VPTIPDNKNRKINFSCNGSLVKFIDKDLEKTPYVTRSKYIAATLEIIHKLDTENDSTLECLEQLINFANLLPVDQIQKISKKQNRDFYQMIKHLVEIGLKYYSMDYSVVVDDPSKLVVEKAFKPKRTRKKRN
jgi:hypothetical protein